MEMIASARMRRARQRALDARPYAMGLSELIGLVIGETRMRGGASWLRRQEAGRVLVVHLTTDKGLCGGLNAGLNHGLGQFIADQPVPVDVVTVGRKGREFAVRTRLDLVAQFSGLGDSPGIADIRPLCRLVTDMFSHGETDRVYLCYPRFVSVTVQQPTVERLLPVEMGVSEPTVHRDFVCEPEVNRVLDALLARYVEASIYHAYLELVASEYSARMVAMHDATNSASEMAEDMTTEMNKLRQAAVTEEVCEVSSGAEALTRGGANG
jgi:F-type H+-transporting ATPase subunit gamma